MNRIFKVPPPILVFVFGIFMYLFRQYLPIYHSSLKLFTYIGVIIVLCGVLINAWGFLYLRSFNTTIDPIRPEKACFLVTEGPYRISRNPMYVGFLLLLIGWGVILGSIASMLWPFLFFIYIAAFQIPREEHALKALFGTDYFIYMKQTPKWLF